ncbi:hypothetical protein ACO0K2_11705 [Undibacterium sp. MH2W]|uniref:hypothetical protein n=1 Tax=Undibacterium sp. MH2W TaxID=3413044 RepID=UPI003BF08911
MFEKFGLFYNVFRQGQAVADAAKLKNKQLLANTLAVLLTSIVGVGKMYGYDFHLTTDDLNSIAGVGAVVFGLFNAGATVASSDKIGLPAKQSDPASEQPMPAVQEVVRAPKPVQSESGSENIWINPPQPGG